MDERTEPVPTADPADPSVIRGPFRSPSPGTRIERRPCPATSTCAACKVPSEHCLCRVEPDRLRYALAQISLIHQIRPDGACAGCGTQAVLCGYLTLLDHARAHYQAPLPAGAHLSGGV